MWHRSFVNSCRWLDVEVSYLKREQKHASCWQKIASLCLVICLKLLKVVPTVGLSLFVYTWNKHNCVYKMTFVRIKRGKKQYRTVPRLASTILWWLTFFYKCWHLNFKIFWDILNVWFSEAHTSYARKTSQRWKSQDNADRKLKGLSLCSTPVAVCDCEIGCILSIFRCECHFFSRCKGKTTFVKAFVILLHSRITPGKGCNGLSFSKTSWWNNKRVHLEVHSLGFIENAKTGTYLGCAELFRKFYTGSCSPSVAQCLLILWSI